MSQLINLKLEEILKNQVQSFAVFSHLRGSIEAIDKKDVQQFEELTNQYLSKTMSSYFYAIVSLQLITLYAKKTNLIYFFTYQISYWGLIKKYYAIPWLLTQPYQRMISEDIGKQRQEIANKYDFNQPLFEEAFQKLKDQGMKSEYLSKKQVYDYLQEQGVEAE